MHAYSCVFVRECVCVRARVRACAYMRMCGGGGVGGEHD